MTSPTNKTNPSRQIRTNIARNIVITGATSGMGKAAAKELARRGARLLLVGRNRQRCEAVTAECIAETANQQVDYVIADLSSIHEVRRVADEIIRRLDRVDTLVNNAGGEFPKQRRETEEGLELAFVLQYLSRHVLTEELLDRLRASEDPHVMTIAGGGGYLKTSTPTRQLSSGTGLKNCWVACRAADKKHEGSTQTDTAAGSRVRRCPRYGDRAPRKVTPAVLAVEHSETFEHRQVRTFPVS